jgi:hypothetical protein
MQSKVQEQLSELRINLERTQGAADETHTRDAMPPARPLRTGSEWLERALNAERRLECLARLAAAVMPPQHGEGGESYRPPSAWRALAREIARANRHLARTKQHPADDV